MQCCRVFKRCGLWPYVGRQWNEVVAVRSTSSSSSAIPLTTHGRYLEPPSVRAVSRTSVKSRSEAQSRRFNTSASDDSTIFALSTAPGKSAIAVVRCSGPAWSKIYAALCPKKPFPEPRRAILRRIHSPSDGSLLDPGALILFFPGPKSVTGEDVLELHAHGGSATVRAVLAAISSLSSPEQPIRYAEPGEFTRRAFYNNRLDLTQIEALGDTLAAETEQQRRLAVEGSSRVLAERYESWRQQLLYARGELEALIDFSEDQHFEESPAQLVQSVAQQVKGLLGQIDASLRNAARGELLRNGIKVALLGAPNVGKSSLLNRIVGREAAIVSSEAGTTRDVVETNVDIGGFFCNFGDLAGLRGYDASLPSNRVTHSGVIGQVEREGIRRAKARALDADVVVVVRACERNASGEVSIPMPDEVADTLQKCDLERQRIVHVVNKVDLLDSPSQVSKLLQGDSHMITDDVVLVCCDTAAVDPAGSGMELLLRRLTDTFTEMTEAVGVPGIASSTSRNEISLGASWRQARLLQDCQTELQAFLEAVEVPDEPSEDEMDIDIVVAAECLRRGADCIARIVGRGHGDVEDVLGVVFENFCVGK